LRNLLSSLSETSQPVEVFFRDDDAGWADERLLELLSRFEHAGLPVDLAVIPAALIEGLAETLVASHAGLHQHGYAHTNHQPEGRKCEFGPARSRAQQLTDIAAGREKLRGLLGDRLDPFFTPPWNRCTADTGSVLVELDFKLLSRESKAEPLGVLPELPVHLDVARLSPEELDTRFAALVGSTSPIGVMFHHGVMEPDDMERASALLEILTHENVVPRRMADLCR
jgi:hypothetical protein